MREATPRKVETYVTQSGTDLFQEWLDDLSDQKVRILIDKTIGKMRLGNLGKHKSLGEGVQEIVLDYGPGYRLYFSEHGNVLIILLCGSTKKGQQEAIDNAKCYWKDWKRRVLK